MDNPYPDVDRPPTRADDVIQTVLDPESSLSLLPTRNDSSYHEEFRDANGYARMRETDEGRRRKHFEAVNNAGFSKRHKLRMKEAGFGPGDRFLLDWGTGTERLELAYGKIKADGGTLLLLGQRGTGKTQIALEMSRRIAFDQVLNPPEQRYRVLAELFAEEKRSWKQEERGGPEPLRKAANVPLLILDEIQERSESAWEDTELTLLFDRRYQNMLRTILIANLTADGAREKLPSSMWSRIIETGTILECDWPSFRGAQ